MFKKILYFLQLIAIFLILEFNKQHLFYATRGMSELPLSISLVTSSPWPIYSLTYLNTFLLLGGCFLFRKKWLQVLVTLLIAYRYSPPFGEVLSIGNFLSSILITPFIAIALYLISRPLTISKRGLILSATIFYGVKLIALLTFFGFLPKPISVNSTLTTPKALKTRMVLATEDLLFFHHFGIDLPRFVQVTYQYISTGSTLRGGSTITMQLMKVRYLNETKALRSKFFQLVLAVLYETLYGKERILTEYLTEVPLGKRGDGSIIRGFTDGSLALYFTESSKLSLDQLAELCARIEDPMASSEKLKSRAQMSKFRNLSFNRYLESLDF